MGWEEDAIEMGFLDPKTKEPIDGPSSNSGVSDWEGDARQMGLLKNLESNGASSEDIKKVKAGFMGQSIPKPISDKPVFNFSDEVKNRGVKDIIKNVGIDPARLDSAKETIQQTMSGEISPVETGVQLVGQTIAAAGDIAGKAISSGYNLLPDSVKE